MKPVIVISLGGSIIVPDQIDVNFLKKFKKVISSFKKYQFIIVTGGGSTARKYTNAAKKFRRLTREEQDWPGIYSTRLNAILVKTLFGKQAYKDLLLNPNKKVKFKEQVALAAGALPEGSSDYNAIVMAHTYNAEVIINMSNTDYIYDKNPKYLSAKPQTHLTWTSLQRIVGKKRISSGHYPFDPVGVQFGRRNNMKLYALNGKRLGELKKAIQHKPFKGTIVHGR